MSSRDSKKLLVVEDDPGLQSALKWAFDGYEVVTAEDREGAIAQLRRHEPGVVTLDLGLPPDAGGATEGLKTLGEILEMAPETKVVVVTGNNDRSNALEATANGAWMFCQKPVDPDLLAFVVSKAYEQRELETETRQFSQADRPAALRGIVATSDQMSKVCKTIEKVAASTAAISAARSRGTQMASWARIVWVALVISQS